MACAIHPDAQVRRGRARRARGGSALVAGILAVLAGGCDAGGALDDGEVAGVSRPGAEVSEAIAWDVSPPLRVLAGANAVSQAETASAAIAAPGVSFDGISDDFAGYNVVSAPPGPAGAVGPNHYLQSAGQSFAVFDRAGNLVFGPFTNRTLWVGFGGPCETAPIDGYASIRYDRMADRWVFAEFGITEGVSGAECIAVSTSGDPTGSYARYGFEYTTLNDLPRIAVWPDAYYFTYNMLNPSDHTFVGAKACAMDRARMLAGEPATQQCFDVPSAYRSLLFADPEGTAAPASGTPAYALSLGVGDAELAFWSLHVDWSAPGASAFTGPSAIPVPAFTRMCNGARSCVIQPGTAVLLDGDDDHLMSGVAYRRVADHEALLATHAVRLAAGSGGMRWYELRDPSAGTPTLFQQGTVVAEDGYRWMGALAMDRLGGVGLAYSLSSSSTYPSIAYTGRLASDPPGTMPQGEGLLVSGTGSQTSLTRWGDWSVMSVDPVDDCTFWFTGEYQAITGSFNWHTRIGSFQVSDCSIDQLPTVSLTAPPAGAIVSGPVTMRASAYDDFAVSKVQFRVDGVLVGTDTSPPYSAVWDSTAVADGSHTLRARAYDSANQLTNSAAIAVTVDNPGGPDLTPPVTSISQPQAGAVVSGTIKVAAKATDDVGVSRVEFYRAGILLGTATAGPFYVPWNTTGVADGRYSLSSKAFDAAGNAGVSAPISVTVRNNVVTTNLLFNGGFETGTLSRWTASGPVAAVSGVFKTGSYAARIGSTSAFDGDAAISQSFSVPFSGVTTLRFWYQLFCEFDNVTYDQQQVFLRGPTGDVTLLDTCAYQPTWTQAVVDLTPFAGQTLTLEFRAHDDGFEFDPTWFYVDAVSVKNVY